MSSPELRESSARMLRVIGGCWPRNVPIPRAAGEDFFTSRMVREWRVFPYGRNIAAVVSAVMDKDRQGAAQKRQAAVRLVEARPKRQRGFSKAAASGGGKPPLAAKSDAAASSKAPEAPNRRRWRRRSAEWRRSRRRPKRCRRQASVSPTSPPILLWRTISAVSRWLLSLSSFFCLLLLLLIRRYVAGSDEGQLAIVAPAAVTTMAAVPPKAKGEALSAGGEVAVLAAVRDEAVAASRRLKEVVESLSQVR
jgi:hypothetical protein